MKNNLLPSLTAEARPGRSRSTLRRWVSSLRRWRGSGCPGTFHEIVKVDTTSAQMNLSQQLFNVPAYYLYRAAQKADDGCES